MLNTTSAAPQASLPPSAYGENAAIHSLFGINADEIVRRMPRRTMPLVIAPEPVSRYTKDFLEAAKHECARQWPFLVRDEIWSQVLIDCDVHHKQPRAFSGDNSTDNLVLIDRGVHPRLHRHIDKILKAAGEVIQHHDPRLKGNMKTLTGWLLTDMDLTPVRDELAKIEGLGFDDAGKILITIPYPDDKVFIPQFLHNLAMKAAQPEWPLNHPASSLIYT